ncbi:MAG: ABC transporter ATP-binding protein [Lachnospiraceae bacterium]|nr:ABC transporter ATP-binding protein [Lachnospiraceae bacterium]
MKHELDKIKDLFHKLNVILSKQQKLYGGVIFVCTILAAVMETIGVSVIIPVVQGLMDTEGLWNKWYIQPFLGVFDIQRTQTLIILVCGEVITVYILKNLYFILYTWLVRKYTYKIKRELGIRVMKSYMKQGYIFFVNNNTSRLIQGISGDVNSVNVILDGFFSLSTKLMTVIAIGVFMLAQSPSTAILLMILAVVSVFAIQLLYKKTLIKYGILLREAERENSKASLEAIQGSKEILVTKRQDFYVKKYVDSINKHIKACIKIEMATLTPGYIIEMICIAGLLTAIVVQTETVGASAEMIETLSVVAVSAFRILPNVSAISSTLNSIRSRMPSFNAAYETIRQVEILEKKHDDGAVKEVYQEKDKIVFNNEIRLNNVSYRYPQTEKYILKSVDFVIKARTSIGIIGPSGAGKSTLVDVLLGLLIPEQGNITMDGEDIQNLGVKWNRNVGYVPQSVYLVDADIRENIAFGIPTKYIEDEMVWKALEMAQLADFVRKQPNGLDTCVGERGVKFSGGQRQRVAIARALYLNPEILILDEATAALDNETEKTLMEAIESLQGRKTLIVVAHRLTTIKNCDYIYEVTNGKIIERDKAEIWGK